MSLKYYMDKFDIDLHSLRGLVEEYIIEFPSEAPNLMSLALDTQAHKINNLRSTQAVLESNHLFLYDVLNQSEKGITSKLSTQYQKLPSSLVFDDEKIVSLLEEK